MTTHRLDRPTELVIAAFQRHFRPTRVDGAADPGTLARLDGLLAHTMNNLMERFTTALDNLDDPAQAGPAAIEEARNALRAAVTELQFQDMASQLIVHTSKVLQGCAYRLASESMGQEDGEAVPFVEEVPERPNPVTQDEMDAGSIELF